MRNPLRTAGTLLASLLLTLFVVTPSAHAQAGFTVSDGRLYDANGTEFVMRGVSHPHAWFTHETGAFADIKALGANTVRVVLSSGHRWERNDVDDVANVVSLCKANRLICVLEVHDTTGYGEQDGAASLDQAVDYWLDVREAVEGEEAYVIVNIGNEPHGNTGYEAWTADTIGAIERLRSAGFTHTLLVDAPNWGQDWTFTMRDNAEEVFASDPAGNTVFSIHMYGVYDTATKVDDYLAAFQDANLPLVIGEFGHYHSDGDPDEDAIMAGAETRGLGYIGWSWSGNSSEVGYLDMVNDFDGNSLTSWGERIFHGGNGIADTSVEASVYGEDGGGGTGPSCSVGYRVVNQWPGGFQGELVIGNTGSAEVNGWRLDWTLRDGQRIQNLWGGVVEQRDGDVRVTNAPHTAIIPSGGSVTVGFTATWTTVNTGPTAFTLNGSACALA
ncbi:cellulase family glycosylhydrolase [Actinoalloteichus spitiensis]|uniref:cellulase family glycosylhydrolase n=1 Tax=Actinoalloteichus spitiensis TaxID=252394 RepID=UPI00035D306D|nr:cellulase family glycosylhydrolase [Actinoalloteichus spitiensis]